MMRRAASAPAAAAACDSDCTVSCPSSGVGIAARAERTAGSAAAVAASAARAAIPSAWAESSPCAAAMAAAAASVRTFASAASSVACVRACRSALSAAASTTGAGGPGCHAAGRRGSAHQAAPAPSAAAITPPRTRPPKPPDRRALGVGRREAGTGEAGMGEAGRGDAVAGSNARAGSARPTSDGEAEASSSRPVASARNLSSRSPSNASAISASLSRALSGSEGPLAARSDSVLRAAGGKPSLPSPTRLDPIGGRAGASASPPPGAWGASAASKSRSVRTGGDAACRPERAGSPSPLMSMFPPSAIRVSSRPSASRSGLSGVSGVTGVIVVVPRLQGWRTGARRSGQAWSRPVSGLRGGLLFRTRTYDGQHRRSTHGDRGSFSPQATGSPP